MISLVEETTQAQVECEVGGLLKEKGIRNVPGRNKPHHSGVV